MLYHWIFGSWRLKTTQWSHLEGSSTCFTGILHDLVTPDNETIKLSQNIRNQTPTDASSHPGKIIPNPKVFV